ncbi:unnamed protein product [Wickerhamomyces anomalus]
MSSETQSLSATKAFDPLKVGSNELSNRIVLAPLTRYRAANNHEPSDLQLEYYTQRAQYPGTLLITEATLVSEQAGGYPNVPGRQADPGYLASQGLSYISASDVYNNDDKRAKAEKANNPLRALTKDEIKTHVDYFVKAAKNAIFGSGFDYVEIHSANGYLFDQFLQSSTNKRTDEYGGSIENRARFLFETIDALIEAVGAEKVAIRLSPWGTFGEMAGDTDTEIVAIHSYVASELQKRKLAGNEIAYLSLVEPEVTGDTDASKVNVNNDWIFLIWRGVVLRTGAFASSTPDYRRIFDAVSQNDRTLIGIGRHFLANPDLLHRLHEGIELNKYHRETFYTPGISYGYTTYPNAGEDWISKDDPASKKEAKVIA